MDHHTQEAAATAPSKKQEKDEKAPDDTLLSQKPVVLSEHEFTSRVDKIVERNFFPDLKRLQAESKALLHGIPGTQVLLSDGILDSNILFIDEGEKVDKEGDQQMSLDQFLATHTSEDNASFGRLMESENTQKRLVYNRIFGNNNDGYKEQNASATKEIGLETWKYTPRNTLMFVPSGIDSSKVSSEFLTHRDEKRILPHNTRLPLDNDQQNDDSWDLESTASISSYAATPAINGYKLVKDPDVFGYSTNGKAKRRGFVMAEASPREKVAMQLTKKQGASARSTPAHNKSGSSTAQRAEMLSPAAQRLLHVRRNTGQSSSSGRRSTSITDNDQVLRQAYNSPYVRRGSPSFRTRPS
ncbi:nuclear protein Es2-domain-containing protein [Coemansia spiralis]|nr:nuclear protein Es2-domain-containing protein [Coemansia spiralis]